MCVQHLQVNALMRRNLQLHVLAKCQNIDAQNILLSLIPLNTETAYLLALCWTFH